MTELEALLFNEILRVLQKTEPKRENPAFTATNVAVGIAPAIGAYINKVLNSFSKSLSEFESES